MGVALRPWCGVVAATAAMGCGPGERPPPPPPDDTPPEWVSDVKCEAPLVAYSQKVTTHEERQPARFEATWTFPVLETPWSPEVAQALNSRIERWLGSTREHLMERIVDSGFWALQASCELSAPAPRCTRFLTFLCREQLISGGMERPYRKVTALPVRLDGPELRTFSLVHLCRPDVDCFTELVARVQRHADARLVFLRPGERPNRSGFPLRIHDLEFGEFMLRRDGLRIDLTNYLPLEAAPSALVDIPLSDLPGLLRPDVLASFQ